MDDLTLIILATAAVAGLLATVSMLRADQRAATTNGEEEQPFAVSTEGMSRCPSCGMGNLVTDRTCASCGKRLPG